MMANGRLAAGAPIPFRKTFFHIVKRMMQVIDPTA
jgi:hypothetical protein